MMSPLPPPNKPDDPADFTTIFSTPEAAERVRNISPSLHDAVAGFWRAPLEGRLPGRLKELLLLAMNAAASALNAGAIQRQVHRARTAGASDADILDVLVTIASLANHALYASVPILEEEWQASGKPLAVVEESNPAFLAAKERFVAIRGFWNPDRDPIAREMPDYFLALTNLSTASWQHGKLSRKEREFVCIAIDCGVTHSYPPGLRIHIRNAIAEGATREEILEIFQLAALMGLEGYVIASEALAVDRLR
jgi:alkylhydroperoxidase/carboxymuconolactone decarboxylase family protein YurZ